MSRERKTSPPAGNDTRAGVFGECEVVARVRENPRPIEEFYDALADLLIDIADRDGSLPSRRVRPAAA